MKLHLIENYNDFASNPMPLLYLLCSLPNDLLVVCWMETTFCIFWCFTRWLDSNECIKNIVICVISVNAMQNILQFNWQISENRTLFSMWYLLVWFYLLLSLCITSQISYFSLSKRSVLVAKVRIVYTFRWNTRTQRVIFILIVSKWKMCKMLEIHVWD